MAVKITHWYR